MKGQEGKEEDYGEGKHIYVPGGTFKFHMLFIKRTPLLPFSCARCSGICITFKRPPPAIQVMHSKLLRRVFPSDCEDHNCMKSVQRPGGTMMSIGHLQLHCECKHVAVEVPVATIYSLAQPWCTACLQAETQNMQATALCPKTASSPASQTVFRYWANCIPYVCLPAAAFLRSAMLCGRPVLVNTCTADMMHSVKQACNWVHTCSTMIDQQTETDHHLHRIVDQHAANLVW